MSKSGVSLVFVLSCILLFSGYAIGGGYAKQVCTARNVNTGARYVGKSGKYVRGSQIGDTAREEACSKAKRFCMNDSATGSICECKPAKKDDGGDCEKIDL